MSDSIEVLATRALAVGGMVDEVLLEVQTSAGLDPGLDPRVATDDRLRELLVGLEQVRNAAEAVQAEVMVALAAEADRLDAAEFAASGVPSRSHGEFVPDEVGVLLACTKVAAGRRYGLALRSQDHPVVWAGWVAGRVDARKVEVICDELAALADPEVCGTLTAVEIAEWTEKLAAGATDYAGSHTWSQTRVWLRRRILALLPEVAELRRGRAEQERRVQITPGDDGMSELWAWLPSVQARQIQQALTSAAHDLSSDRRTMDQRRADLLVDWLLGPDHAPTVHLHLITAPNTTADTGAGAAADDVVAWLPGVGSLTELQTSDLIGSAGRVITTTTGEVGTDSEPGYRPSARLDRAVRTRDVTCRFPGCQRAALGTSTGTDVDHTVAWPAGPTAATNLAVLCRRHHRLKHSPGWHMVLHPDHTVTWTTPTGRTYTTEPWHHTNSGSTPMQETTEPSGIAAITDRPRPPPRG